MARVIPMVSGLSIGSSVIVSTHRSGGTDRRHTSVAFKEHGDVGGVDCVGASFGSEETGEPQG